MTLVHGGQLQQIAQQYARPITDWLDLSTGISPFSYPIPSIPTAVWQQLPQPSPTLLSVAQNYYATDNIVATSGSQAVIKQLPLIFKQHVAKQATVWLPRVGYKEHERAWREHGFHICQYDRLPTTAELTKHCIVVVINPNNPTGKLITGDTLLILLADIQAQQGWLIVDEAFIEAVTDNQSVIAHTHNPHLLVLRSIGKFFGLAGIRLGFLSAHPHWLQALARLSSPWEVNGPAQYITQHALMDKAWQQQQALALTRLATKLAQLLTVSFNSPVTGTALFQTVLLTNAAEIYTLLCQEGVYVRLCDEQNALRFGIPNETDLIKLTRIIGQLSYNKI